MQQKVLITGAGGQLGQELVRSCGAHLHCVPLSRRELDLAHEEALLRALDDIAPQQVVNAAAYTAVDAAESDAAAAWRGNAEGPRLLARACAQRGIRVLHVSTDFVFDGESPHPYTPEAPTAPLGEYGRSKLAGEQAVLEECPGALIMRTGWVYSRFGGNFVKTMMRLMAERDELAVVADQVGTPTWAAGLAQANAELPHLVSQVRAPFLWLDGLLGDGRTYLTGNAPAAIDAQIYYAVWFLRGRWDQGPWAPPPARCCRTYRTAAIPQPRPRPQY